MKQIEKRCIDCVYMDLIFEPNSNEIDFSSNKGLIVLQKLFEVRKDIPVMINSAYAVGNEVKKKAYKLTQKVCITFR